MPHDEERRVTVTPTEEEGDENLQAARENTPIFSVASKKKVGKMLRHRWDRLDKSMRKKQAQLKVNHRRYKGDQWVQVHPKNPNRVWEPPVSGNKRTPPSLNKIRRSVHRYAAQVTADQPVIEGLPARHDNEARDAAEAATHGLRGEWHRMNLQRELQRAAHLAGIMRSSFWFFQFDETAGGKAPAEKFFVDEETNERYVAFVNSDGEEVDDPKDAATIWKGQITVELMSPMNVRWNGSRYAHEADELMVGKLVTLRDLFKAFPETREMALEDLLSNVPREGKKWLQDIRGEEFDSGDEVDYDDFGIDNMLGRDVKAGSRLLDQPVFLMHYFLPPDKQYPKGFHGIIAGNRVVHRGTLRYGLMPVAHFKLLDETDDILGLSVVDMVKDPQELLDFVRGKIVQHLHMLRRRWFLPQQSNVSVRDLMNPTRSVIEYNAKAGEPKAETQPEIPRSIFEFLDQTEDDYDDLLGIGPLSKGQHVPGVQSGRHAEALQQGDRTLLGLTREQFKTALEHAGLVLLEMMKKEWTTERRVQYMGEGRQWIDKALSRTDFGETGAVRLKESTLLMLTRSQRLETIFSYAEVGAITPDDVRRLAPLADTAGLELDEDIHFQRARRQNERFFEGPNKAAEAAFKRFQVEVSGLTERMEAMQKRMAEESMSQEAAQAAVATIQERAVELQEEFDAEMRKVMPTRRASEDMPSVAIVHAEQHAIALADDKVSRLPEWWVEWFEQNHFMPDVQAAAPPPEAGEGQGDGMGPGEIEAAANPQELPPPGL